MKNKKGFTLVELVIVVALLGLFGISIGLSLNGLLNKSRNDEYENFVSRIESSANMFVTNNGEIMEELYTNKGYVVITANDLIENGLIDETIINPETGTSVNPEDIIKITLTSLGTVGIEYQSTIPDEDYLQVMDIVVEIKSTEESLCYKDINDYGLRYVKADGSVSSTYLKYTTGVAYYDISDENITIKCDDSKVDLTKLGTYKIDYDYKVEGMNKWKPQSRKVIVVDTIAPNITSLTVSNNNSSEATLICSATDFGSGIRYYYIGTESNLTNISKKGIDVGKEGSEGISQLEPISESGTYYCYAQDVAGNISKKSAEVNIISATTTTTNTTTTTTRSPIEHDLICETLGADYLQPLGEDNYIEVNGEKYYAFKVTTDNERLACHITASLSSSNRTGSIKGKTYYFRKISDGENSEFIQWYQRSEEMCYSVGQMCKASESKRLKPDSSTYTDDNRCFATPKNTYGYNVKQFEHCSSGVQCDSDTELSDFAGCTVSVIQVNDNWFYSPNVGDSGVACFIYKTSFTN